MAGVGLGATKRCPRITTPRQHDCSRVGSSCKDHQLAMQFGIWFSSPTQPGPPSLTVGKESHCCSAYWKRRGSPGCRLAAAHCAPATPRANRSFSNTSSSTLSAEKVPLSEPAGREDQAPEAATRHVKPVARAAGPGVAAAGALVPCPVVQRSGGTPSGGGSSQQQPPPAPPLPPSALPPYLTGPPPSASRSPPHPPGRPQEPARCC